MATIPVRAVGSAQESHPGHYEAPYLVFIAASLAFAIGGGFLLSLLLPLARTLDWAWGGDLRWSEMVQLHGQLQLIGFAGLFVMGMALRIMPRVSGRPLALQRLIPWLVPLIAGYLILRSMAHPLEDGALRDACLIASEGLYALASAAFAAITWATLIHRTSKAEATGYFFVLGAVALGVTTTAWSTLLNFGPDHAWAWLTPTTEPGLIAGGVLALLAAFMSRRANAAWGLVVLTALIALMAEAPSDPYLLESLQFWEQGRFVNLYGLAQWVGWLWPFAALAWLLYGVTQSDRPLPPRPPEPPPGGRSEGQAGRDETHERPVGGNPETTIPR